MNPIASFRDRLYQINTEVLLTPFPELSEKMALTTQSLKAEYGDISRGAGDQQGIAAAVIGYLKNHDLPSYRNIKYVCSGQLVGGAGQSLYVPAAADGCLKATCVCRFPKTAD